MPELPEVQTIVSDLNKKIKGDTIADFWSDWPKAIKGKSLAAFRKEIRGRKILGARRIGKNIFLDLSGGKTLYIHLKMTGHLLVKQAVKRKEEKKSKNYFDEKVNQYIHHIFYLISRPALPASKHNKTLEFSDVRKFAKIVLDDEEKINNLPEIKKLGIDALNEKFTPEKFGKILNENRNKKIGAILTDQAIIAGVGNIYRSEILHEAGIAPNRTAKKLSSKEIKEIYKATKKVLKKAVKMRGTSDSDYRDTSGAPGKFQNILKVYRRTGKPCRKCGKIIRRSILGQRSVFYCSACQR